jgi:multidrug resistance efflux pump
LDNNNNKMYEVSGLLVGIHVVLVIRSGKRSGRSRFVGIVLLLMVMFLVVLLMLWIWRRLMWSVSMIGRG